MITDNLTEYRLDQILMLERRPVKQLDLLTEYREIGIYCFGKGIFHKPPRTGFEVGDKDLYLIREGDFILQITFAWEGAIGLASKAEDGMYGSSRFPTFRVNGEICYSRYLLHYFRTANGVSQLAKISPGSAGRNRVLSLKRLPEVKISLPSLDEQRRIVARIEAVASRVAEAQRLRVEAIGETDAILQKAIAAELGEIRVDGQLQDVLNGKPRNGWSPRCNNDPSGIPVLSLSAVTGFQYQSEAFKRTTTPTKPDAHYWLQDGDLLITRSNTPELVGHAAIYNGSPSPCIYSDLMMRIPVDSTKASLKFVHWWMQSKFVRDYITESAKGTSPTMKKINQGTVMATPFPSRLTLGEQEDIVKNLDELQNHVKKLQRLQAATQGELDALLPAILDKAFRGEL